MRKKRVIKVLISIMLLLFTTIVASCAKEKDPNTIPVIEDINAAHQVYNDDFTSYLLILNKKEKNDLKTSITVYSHILPSIGTSRYFDYYQVDWTLQNNVKDKYYHIFDVDKDERNYGQNFYPFNVLEDELKYIDVLFKYNYVNTANTFINESFTYREEILMMTDKIINNEELFNKDSFFSINVNKDTTYSKEVNRYNIQIHFNDILSSYVGSHIDFQSWIIDNNELVPFYGIYHYQLNNGQFDLQKPPLDIDSSVDIKELYVKLNYYTTEEVKTYFYKISI